MCRLFGMTGGHTRINATFWLLDAPDSLSIQSHAEPDGTGLGVFNEHGLPEIYRQPIAAYEDTDFAREAQEVVSTTFVAHIRFASTGAIAAENTHPFEQNGRLFAHNGVIGDLPKLEAKLGDYRSLVKGETDSERFFALVTKEADANDGDLTLAMSKAAAWASKNIPIYSLNFVLTTPTDMWALRYPETHELYVLERQAGGSQGTRHFEGASASRRVRVRSHHLTTHPAVIVATEPLDKDPEWRAIEPGHLIHVNADLGVNSHAIVDTSPTIPLRLGELDDRAVASQKV